MQSVVPSRHPKYRTKLCRNFASGNCPFGQKCSFVHPASRVDPPSSVQYRFHWNPILLPQLLALSNQQGTQTGMLRRSPPQPQGLQLIDEDPSPTTSLLLSKSDCTSSEQMSQTRRSNKRKKYPCRHFVRTGGWCPAAEQCKFHHDVTALPATGPQKAEPAPPFATDSHGGRAISGGVLMGIQSSAPPITSQVYPEPRYNAAKLMQPYQHTYWPSCTWPLYPPYYNTVPATASAPLPATVALSSVAQHTAYSQLPPSAQAVAPSESRVSLPLGSYQVNGTTYFPTSMPSVPVPVPVYPYYPPPTLPTSYYEVPNQTTHVGSQSSFNPFASDPMTHNDLPVIPQPGDYQMSPTQQDVLILPLAASGNLSMTSPTGKPTVTQEHEFPYRPPKDQQVGHARRISVNIKKHSRVNSG